MGEEGVIPLKEGRKEGNKKICAEKFPVHVFQPLLPTSARNPVPGAAAEGAGN